MDDDGAASVLPEVQTQQVHESIEEEDHSVQPSQQMQPPLDDEYRREVEIALQKVPEAPVESEEEVVTNQATYIRDPYEDDVEPVQESSFEDVNNTQRATEQQPIPMQQNRERLISFQDNDDYTTPVYQPKNHFPIDDNVLAVAELNSFDGAVAISAINLSAIGSAEESSAQSFSFLRSSDSVAVHPTQTETPSNILASTLPLKIESQTNSSPDPLIEVPTIAVEYSSAEDQLLQESTARLISLDVSFREQDGFQRRSLLEASEIRRGLLEEARLRENGAARLNELEAEQTKLAQLEEFEKADQLSADMDSLREQIEGGAARIARLLARQSALEKEFHKKMVSHAKEVRQSAESLHAWHKLLRDEFRRGAKEKSSSLAAEKALLAAEQERLQLEQNQCRREEETVNAELLVTEEAIAGQSAELRNHRTETEVALETVREDIRYHIIRMIFYLSEASHGELTAGSKSSCMRKRRKRRG